MKKVLLAIAACFVFVSCSKDNDDLEKVAGMLTDGLYAYYDTDYAVMIGTAYKDGWSYNTGCEPGYITITFLPTTEYVFTQTQEIIQFTKDGCKGWEYNNGLKILCVPTSNKRFTGRVLKNTSGLQLPEEMEFNKIK